MSTWIVTNGFSCEQETAMDSNRSGIQCVQKHLVIFTCRCGISSLHNSFLWRPSISCSCQGIWLMLILLSFWWYFRGVSCTTCRFWGSSWCCRLFLKIIWWYFENLYNLWCHTAPIKLGSTIYHLCQALSNLCARLSFYSNCAHTRRNPLHSSSINP